jgi:glycerol-3-phosphate acyltransferase PlsY
VTGSKSRLRGCLGFAEFRGCPGRLMYIGAMKTISWRNTLLLLATAALLLVLAVLSRDTAWSPVLLILAAASLTMALLFGKRGV